MSVVEVLLKSVSGGVDKDGERQYTKVWHVKTDDKDDGPITARTAPGIDARLDTFSHGNDVDNGAELLDKRAVLLSEDDSYRWWKVTGKFESPTFEDNEGGDAVDDPLDLRVRWSGSFLQFTRDYLRDKDGNTIKNSAGDPMLEPPVQGDDSRLSIICRKNFGSLNVNTWASFRDAVNDSTWWGLAARKLKVQSITWEQKYFQQLPYYDVRFEFHVNDDTWDKENIDAGYYYLEGDNRKRISEALGRDINRPWPLTTAGAIMPTTDVNAGNENYISSKIYNERNFANLNIPSVLGAPA